MTSFLDFFVFTSSMLYRGPVITHDEKFVDLLGKRDVADYFFRVSKDRSGFSVIHQVPMSEE